MKVKIYGTGCAKCQRLAETVASVIESSGTAAELEKVTDIDAIVARGVMMTPALEVDGKIVASGRIPEVDEIRTALGISACSCGCSCGAGKKGRFSLKNAVGLGLVAFALVAIGVSVVKEQAKPVDAAVPASAEAVSAATAATVYYFHGERRCRTCNTIEALTRSTVDTAFAEETKAGRVVFKSVNLDEAANEHFIADFGLTIRSVVVAKGDKFERLDRVWELVGDEEKFRAYVAEAVRKML